MARFVSPLYQDNIQHFSSALSLSQLRRQSDSWIMYGTAVSLRDTNVFLIEPTSSNYLAPNLHNNKQQ